VLARARLRHDAPLAHALRQERLPQRVVDLVRAGVRQVFALQVDARPAQVPRSAARRSDRSRTPAGALQVRELC
jgi:hypothetical protein